MSTPTETLTEHDALELASPPKPGLIRVYGPGGVAFGAWPLEPELTLGREGSVGLADDGKISRHHATVVARGSRVVLRDEGSRNGTFLDGHRLEGGREVPLASGAVLRLGRSLLMLVADVRGHRDLPSTGLDRRLLGGGSLDAVRDAIRRAAASKLPCLIDGETGTGKERVAETLHFATDRPGDFVAINCAALPPGLAESELFGHVEGAFSGSGRSRRGLFARADRGTLLLDELGELPLDLQAKLLRVLEERRLRPVGSDTEQAIDVQLVAATNRSLDSMVAEGTFREDLLHRVAALRIHLPPLRERREDVPRLTQHFVGDLDEPLGFTAAAMEGLMLRRWPGNLRELRHATRLAVATAAQSGHEQVEPADLPPPPPDAPRPTASALDDRQRIEAALARHGGNVSRACRDLGVSRSWFYEVVKRLGIEPASHR